MMKKYRSIIILFNLILLLFFFNSSIFKKEKILDDGELILLKLAPVDPRSLMQGDYMILQYEMTRDIYTDSIPTRGFCVVKLDSSRVASRVRLQKGITPINEGEYLIEYRLGSRELIIGAESFFFQEGDAGKYGQAKYGAVMIDEVGNSVLVGLYNEQLEKIE